MAGADGPAVPAVLIIGWYGTYLPLIVPAFLGNAFFIFLIRQYMRTIPRELDEAAVVDGAEHIRIFWSVILPLCKPVLAVCAVFVFLGTWNDLLGPLIYLDSSQFTVAIGLANSVTRRHTEWNLLMAANLLMMVPPSCCTSPSRSDSSAASHRSGSRGSGRDGTVSRSAPACRLPGIVAGDRGCRHQLEVERAEDRVQGAEQLPLTGSTRSL